MKKFQVTVNGSTYQVEVEELGSGQAIAAPKVSAPSIAPVANEPQAVKAPQAASTQAAGSTKVDAPMQGKIVGVKVSVGDTVKAGDVLVILEAMKMENEIVSPAAGKVASVNVNVGQSVNSGDLMVSLN